MFWVFLYHVVQNIVEGILILLGSLCGLLYVGETKGQLNKRMNGQRSEINYAGV